MSDLTEFFKQILKKQYNTNKKILKIEKETTLNNTYLANNNLNQTILFNKKSSDDYMKTALLFVIISS